MSRDIGPALPPHLRKDHGSKDEDAGRSSGYRYKEENKRKHRERQTEKERIRDGERCRTRDRGRYGKDEGKEKEKSTKYSDRDYDGYHLSKGTERHARIRYSNPEEKNHGRYSSGTSHSKRSKTDRTYNTDTEESSDDSSDYYYPSERKMHPDDSDCSEKGKTDEPVNETESSPECEISRNTGADGREQHVSCGDVPIGPALPPHLLKCKSGVRSPEKHSPGRLSQKDDLEEAAVVGPALPPHSISSVPHSHKKEEEAVDHERHRKSLIGPALPPSLRSKIQTEDSEQNTCLILGPSLPPLLKSKILTKSEEREDHLKSSGAALPGALHSEPTQIGPTLPPHLRKEILLNHDSNSESDDIGPIPCPDQDESLQGDAETSDDEVVGPMLPDQMTKSGKNYVVQTQLERNAAAVKRKLQEKDLPSGDAASREEWMLELPPEGTVDLGLGPRTFRTRGAPEKGADRSMWTDTPADKARKEEEAKQRFELGISSNEEVRNASVSRELSRKDRAMEAEVKRHKRSKESLLDSHQKKLQKEKKKKEKAGVVQERRPFNRETDLKTNVFDDAQKKAIYKKAQLLDSRFSSGESKYL